MEYNRWIKDWKTALTENFFLRSLCLLLGIGLILNAVVFRSRDRVIISPPQVTKEYWIETSKASPEYLEQMGAFFATLGGNLSPGNAEYNVSVLVSYVYASSHAEVKRDLAAQAQYIKKHNITQAFFPSSVNVDYDNSLVSVSGIVVRNIGTVRVDQEEMIIRMKFKMDTYKLYLIEFYTDYPSRKEKDEKEKSKEKEKEKEKTKTIEQIKEKAKQ